MEIPKSLSRFFSKEPTTDKVRVSDSTSGDNRYQFEEGKIYIPFGGKEEDIPTECGCCGGPFIGPTQAGCEYCGTQRSVYMRDVTELQKENLSILSDDGSVAFPAFGGQDLTIGGDVIIDKVSGDTVNLSTYVEAKRVGGNEVNVGDGSEVNIIIGLKIAVGNYVSVDKMLGKLIKLGDDNKIDTLIVADGGKLETGSYVDVKTLILGKNASLDMGDGCNIGKINATGKVPLSVGSYSNVGPTKKISSKEFGAKVEKCLVMFYE